MPEMEFELIEVDEQKNNSNEPEEPVTEEPEEFAFPLFSAPSAEVMTVTMNDAEEEEEINNERPESYYKAIYSKIEKEEFLLAAVDSAYVFEWSQTVFPDLAPWKVVDLKKHNEDVDQERKKHRKRRAGKKKRESAILCRERRQTREKEVKKLRREQEAREKKKRFKKWNGPGAKTKQKVPAKPKYRTE